jgi:hypothetical protein
MIGIFQIKLNYYNSLVEKKDNDQEDQEDQEDSEEQEEINNLGDYNEVKQKNECSIN